MLSELYIENVAVIEKASIELVSGFNVFTGETGAGKSILIGAINSILGNRTSKDIVRTGANKAVITALFTDISNEIQESIRQLEICEIENNELLISRQIFQDGRSVCKIGTKPVTVSMLKEIAPKLINIHGQHDTHSLLDCDKHLSLVDSYAELQAQLIEYLDIYKRLVKTKKQLDSFNMDKSLLNQKIEILSYQVKEIEDMELEDGELEKLEEENLKYRNFKTILSLINQSLNYLSLQNEQNISTIELVDKAADSLEKASIFMDDLSEISERLTTLSYELNEISDKIAVKIENLDYDEDRANYVRERINSIYSLKKKYGNSIAEILKFYKDAKSELENINISDEKCLELEDEFLELKKEVVKKAKILSNKREVACEKFIKNVCDELTFLEMPNVKLESENNKGKLSSSGIDNLQFLISTNIGQEAKPLSKIASGGELSRIMLAIKSVMSDKDDIDTMIFDEIDTGVSGIAAQKIGRKLQLVSENRQVICVTHTAQIAALADNHIFIRKTEKANQTFTKIDRLNKDQRIKELARIISGDKITPTTLKNAQEMIELGRKA